MEGYAGSAVPRELLDPRFWVTDIVYFPLETQLLREAAQAGCVTLDGSGMTVHQAAGAFTHFTGRPADPQRMQASFRAALAGGGR
jgi:shikimate dehydrogenase